MGNLTGKSADAGSVEYLIFFHLKWEKIIFSLTLWDSCNKKWEKAKKKTFFSDLQLDKQLFKGYLIQHTQNVAG